MVTAVVAAPVAEEMVFRGLIQTTLGRLFAWVGRQRSTALAGAAAAWPHTPAVARWGAVVVTSALFAAVHVSAEPAAVFPIFVLSLGLGFVYERSGNLWMNTVTHALFNGAELVLFLSRGGG